MRNLGWVLGTRRNFLKKIRKKGGGCQNIDGNCDDYGKNCVVGDFFGSLPWSDWGNFMKGKENAGVSTVYRCYTP